MVHFTIFRTVAADLTKQGELCLFRQVDLGAPRANMVFEPGNTAQKPLSCGAVQLKATGSGESPSSLAPRKENKKRRPLAVDWSRSRSVGSRNF
eukprot:3207979-Pleurochrysis_carterae.AAC.1